MKYIMIFLFLGACTQSIPYGDSDLTLGTKLENTLWISEGFRNQKSVDFTTNSVKFKTGPVLGSSSMVYTILDQDEQYVLYSIVSESEPLLVGVTQLDSSTIQLLVWQSEELPLRQDAMSLISNRGSLFNLKEKT